MIGVQTISNAESIPLSTTTEPIPLRTNNAKSNLVPEIGNYTTIPLTYHAETSSAASALNGLKEVHGDANVFAFTEIGKFVRLSFTYLQ